MKLLFAVCFLLASQFAYASGELVGGVSYLDNLSIAAPTLGFAVKEQLPLKLEVEAQLLGGYINQALNPDGSQPNGFFGDLSADLYEPLGTESVKLGVGGGVSSSVALYNSFQNYAHATLTVKCW